MKSAYRCTFPGCKTAWHSEAYGSDGGFEVWCGSHCESSLSKLTTALEACRVAREALHDIREGFPRTWPLKFDDGDITIEEIATRALTALDEVLK